MNWDKVAAIVAVVGMVAGFIWHEILSAERVKAIETTNQVQHRELDLRLEYIHALRRRLNRLEGMHFPTEETHKHRKDQ